MGAADNLPRRPITNPYFVSMSKEVRLCPVCGSRTRLNGTLDPDAALEACTNPDCRWFQALEAPEWARGKKAAPKSHLRLVD